MKLSKIKKGKEYFRRGEEEIVRMSSQVGFNEKIKKELADTERKLEEIHSVYEIEFNAFDTHRSKMENDLCTKAEILGCVRAKHQEVCEESAGIMQRRIEAVSDYHAKFTELQKKIEKIDEYMKDAKQRCVETKESVAKRKEGYERELGRTNDALEAGKRDL